MNDRRWESLDPDDESFVDHALRAGRDELPDEARMRALEGRLGRALESEAAPSGWWRWSRLYPVVGLAIVALGVRAGTSSSPAPSASAALAPIETAPSAQVTASTEPIPSVEPMPSVEPTSSAPSVSIDALPSAESPAPQPAKVAGAQEARPHARPATHAALPSGPSDELALLEAASRALDASPERALALTDEHLKRFRSPKFAQERERLAVVALVRLGRREDAKRRAEAFEAAFPESAHLTRVRELVRP